jgi:FAD/FMN-containing dehydrogenase
MHKDRDGALVDYEPFFYPLDGLRHWNRIYGRRGFAQYQALFPTESSHRGMVALLEEIARSRIASFLAVLKSTGAAGEGLLSFPMEGHTLALDLPNASRRLVELADRLDRIVLDHGGRLYLAKDSLTSASHFAAMYPGRLEPFRAVKESVDPRGRFASAQARRLGLVEDRR